jgi:sulfide dehydrogenase [flavocytochrome c] flavoprotein chain
MDYGGLRQHGVQVLRDEVTQIDTSRKRVILSRIADQPYDRLVISPGIDFVFPEVRGLDDEAQKTVLHAWKAGPQTVELRQQLEAMPDGGVYVLTIPPMPYRCPPGPYERVCQVARYFRDRKPRSKIIVLDANPDLTSKKGLFLAAWNGLYPGMIEYRPSAKIAEVDARNRTAITDFGDRVRADVLNVVPPHRAGEIARSSGLANVNDRWCDVNWMTLESTTVKDVHVLGDATMSAPMMPKSGHMANQHGKVAASAIVQLMQGREPVLPVMANTCYSYVDDRNAMHVASVHQWSPGKKTIEPVTGAGGLSSSANEIEGRFAWAWAQNIWRDMLA